MPTGITVSCQDTRSLTQNRKIARKLLEKKVEHAEFGKESKMGKAITKKQKAKATKRRKAIKKVQAAAGISNSLRQDAAVNPDGNIDEFGDGNDGCDIDIMHDDDDENSVEAIAERPTNGVIRPQ